MGSGDEERGPGFCRYLQLADKPGQPQTAAKPVPFNELFTWLPSHRDRALVAFWISTGARASELSGATCSGAEPGQQLITVIADGSQG